MSTYTPLALKTPWSGLQLTTIVLFFALLVVWVVAITKPREHPWSNNPWLPTMVGALLWSVWIERLEKH